PPVLIESSVEICTSRGSKCRRWMRWAWKIRSGNGRSNSARTCARVQSRRTTPERSTAASVAGTGGAMCSFMPAPWREGPRNASGSLGALLHDCPFGRRRDVAGVLGEDAVLVARLRRLPLLSPRGELLGGDVHVDQPLVAVERDHVAVLD